VNLGVSRSAASAIAAPCGSVQGLADEHETFGWRGIPYARPPLGAHRWQPPTELSSWSDVLEATRFGPDPWQYGFPDTSEDCLYLNIWRPADATEQLPVFVWLPGGTDDGRQVPRPSVTPGAWLAARARLVVVTVGFRIAELGWFAHPALTSELEPEGASGNYGTLDILAALTWIQRNVAAFGGDPHNVLVAGGASAGHHAFTLLLSPLATGLFHKLVVLSPRTETHEHAAGCAHAERLLHELLVEEHGSAKSALALRSRMSPREVAGFLRNVPPERLATARGSVVHEVFRDGVVIHERGFGALADGSYPNKVPVLVGTNQDEARYSLMRHNPWMLDDLQLFRKVSAVASLRRHVACDQVLRQMCGTPGQPDVYGYIFRWGSALDHPSVLPDPVSSWLGAAYGMEMPFLIHGGRRSVFGAGAFNSINEEGRLALGWAMSGYLERFAYTGRPGSPAPGLPDWEPWTNQPGGRKRIVLDADLVRPLIHMQQTELEGRDVDEQLSRLAAEVRGLTLP
jgi:para-nitrobenzyl esterase